LYSIYYTMISNTIKAYDVVVDFIFCGMFFTLGILKFFTYPNLGHASLL